MNKEVLALAKMIDHSLLHPTMTDADLKEGCQVAKAYHAASVCIKPYAIKLAVDELKGSDVLVGTVIGFPHGNSAVSVKVAETIQACKDGAVEIVEIAPEQSDFLGQPIQAFVETETDNDLQLAEIAPEQNNILGAPQEEIVDIDENFQVADMLQIAPQEGEVQDYIETVFEEESPSNIRVNIHQKRPLSLRWAIFAVSAQKASFPCRPISCLLPMGRGRPMLWRRSKA